MLKFLAKKWNIVLYFVFIGVMLLMVATHDNAGYDESYKIKGEIDFSDNWEYDFENGISGVTSLPHELEKSNADKLVLTNQLPTLNKDMEFIFRARHVAVKIYVGDELRADTTVDRDLIGIYYQEVELTREDSGKIIRVESYSDVQRYLRSPGAVYLGDRGSMFLSLIRNKWATLGFVMLLGFLGIALAIMWFLYAAVMKIKSREVLCLALFTIGVAMWLFTESDLAQFFIRDTGKVSILAYEVLMLLPVPIALFFYYYSDRRSTKHASSTAATVPIFLFIINNLLDCMEVAHLSESLKATQIVLGLEIIAVAIIQVREIIYKFKQKEKYSSVVWKIPLVGIGVLVPLAMGEVFKYLFVPTKYANDGMMISFGVFFYMFALAMDSIVRMNYRTEKFKESSEVKTQFLANMSHEIRTPLNAILGFNEVILRTTTEEKTRNYSADIQHAGENLKSIINSILDISKIESGKLELYSVEYSTIQLYDHVISMFEAMAKKKGLSFNADIDGRIPEVLIGDENHIMQVIVNIMSNAIKYTEKGTVTFTVRLLELPEDVPLCKLYFSIKDTGMGIKEEDKERLFEKFERLDTEKNRNAEGTGLGMSIVVQLLRAMGSEIQLDSEYGVGSDFHFELTQSVVNKEVIGSFVERRKELALANSEFAEFIAPEAKVLIVDDVQMNLDMARAVLEELQMQIYTAMSGKEAIEMVSQEHFDLVLMDHMMPEMDGIEATEHIRNLAVENEDVYYAELPILALTANAMVGMKEKFFMAGMQDFISKPIEVNVLYKAIEKWLPKNKKQKISKEEMNALKEEMAIKESEWENVPEFINLFEARQYCASYDLFCRNIRNYCDGCDATTDKLREFKEAKDAANYKITVHGLKSTSKMIGLPELSAMALEQEENCATGNEPAVWPKTEELLSMYNDYVEKLREFFGLNHNDEDESNACSNEEYASLLERIKEAAENFDMGEFITLEDEMAQLCVPEDKKEEFASLKEMVVNASFGEVKEFFSYQEACKKLN